MKKKNLKTLLKVTVLAIVTINLLSCGSKRKMVESNSVETGITSIEKMVENREEVDFSSFLKSSLNGNAIVNIREYDTTKPVDSITGLPPVLKDIEITYDFIKEDSLVTKENKISEIKDSIHTSSSFVKQDEVSEKSETKSSWSSMENILSISAIIIFFVTLLLIIKKIRNAQY